MTLVYLLLAFAAGVGVGGALASWQQRRDLESIVAAYLDDVVRLN